MINMPFFSPNINPFDSGRGILRVNTERRFLPPFKKNGVGAVERINFAHSHLIAPATTPALGSTGTSEAIRIHSHHLEEIRNMSKVITLRVSEDHYEAFKKYAKTENRKISNAIETLAMKQLENALFTDDFETEGILADGNLLARIKAGVKQAKERKGRFEVIVLRPTCK
jgi:hypothetical protein